jgi:hypothetical protein
MDSRRREPRRSYFARAILTYQDELDSKVIASGMIEDRSAIGLGIRVTKPIRVGCVIQIELGGRQYSGVVRRCSTCKPEEGAIGEYFVGIEIDRT